MTPKQQRMFRKIESRFDFSVADRLRASLLDACDFDALAALDELQDAAQLPRTARLYAEDVDDIVFIDGAECQAFVTRRFCVDLEDGLEKPRGACEMPRQMCKVQLTPTGGSRSRRAYRGISDERRRAQDVAAYRAACNDASF